MEFSKYIQSPIHPLEIHKELEHSYLYYQNLNPILKQRFVERSAFFIAQKKFVARQGLDLTNRIRIIISACAIQVTFGLDSYTLDNFEYVVIYPDIYESPLTHQMHRGETNLNGFICLSWKHILVGIENPSDNYNLGLHEWTHALRFNSINYEETDYFFDGYINKWVAGAMFEFANLKNGKQSIFRRYGASNIHEFLSVCTEHFFESPDEFKLNAPDLFDQMCILFNQLPSKVGSARIGVRNTLLKTNAATTVSVAEQIPVLVLEASFLRTITNMGMGLLYFSFSIVLLIIQFNLITSLVALLVVFGGILLMNYKYFTIKFYDNKLYIQSGFIESFANKLSIDYQSLIKMEIFDGNFDTGFGTVFQLNYYDGNYFSKRVAYCSSIDIPYDKIKTLLQQKKVAVLFPS
ncbi:MAG: hypothetical protein A3F72_21055 [Bacteroidetes bacterium RIFCSPLOWO2_12_FULL_35_15]|nr:MAG: hypothetical protein A3F72_21055 [Bacteroidetes bacterium RIFCSPLOWO2_12_FULL_35_15]